MDSRETVKAAGVGIAIITGLLVLIILTVLFCWPTMLMFGVVHGFYAAVPAFGLWQTFLVMVLARLVVGSLTQANTNS